MDLIFISLPGDSILNVLFSVDSAGVSVVLNDAM